ncbi:hypothetical protein [Thermospira aquatica]|uniref:Uncharacterized protein n=1 Tax=Thermospira aquatica TaxID=2828656 RepID=A0AAX3BE45_9SPIR|nr:hypothetical protein [Thermospira aquatica]URA10604.1 hypothetical protein KDW03_02025 [Thermospira aquatica]
MFEGDLFTGKRQNNIKKPAKGEKGDAGLLCEDNRPKNRNYAARLLRATRKNHICRQKNYLKTDIAKRAKDLAERKNSAKRN